MTFWVAGTIVVGSLINANSVSNAASTAAEASTQASGQSVDEQRRQFDISQMLALQARDQARADQQPFLTAGTGAVNRLGAGVGVGGEFGAATPFNFQYDQSTDPSYGFRFSEGMKALDRSAASRGGLLSGATLRGATRFGQDLAAGSRQNAFNEYLTGFNAQTGERNQLYNRLAGVAGTGQTTAGQVASQGMTTASNLGTMGANMAGNIGNAYMSSAANTGNAAMAAAGIRNSAFSSGANVLGRMYGYGGYGRNNNYPSSIGAPAGVGSFDDFYANMA